MNCSIKTIRKLLVLLLITKYRTTTSTLPCCLRPSRGVAGVWVSLGSSGTELRWRPEEKPE